MRKIHISDSNAKNTFVYFAPIKPPKNPLKAFGKERVFSKRVIISGEQSDYENLLNKYQETKARLWVVPPTKMDEQKLIEEGEYKIFKDLGARTELPGCSLCMGNQARVIANSTVISTSTRNFPNRMGDGANVFLASAELSAISSILGKIPTVEEYHKYMNDINPFASDIYKYLNFNEIDSYIQSANSAEIPTINLSLIHI